MYVHNIPYLVLLRVNLKKHQETCMLLFTDYLSHLHCSVRLVPLRRWRGVRVLAASAGGVGEALLEGLPPSVSSLLADFIFYH